MKKFPQIIPGGNSPRAKAKKSLRESLFREGLLSFVVSVGGRPAIIARERRNGILGQSPQIIPARGDCAPAGDLLPQSAPPPPPPAGWDKPAINLPPAPPRKGKRPRMDRPFFFRGRAIFPPPERASGSGTEWVEKLGISGLDLPRARQIFNAFLEGACAMGIPPAQALLILARGAAMERENWRAIPPAPACKAAPAPAPAGVGFAIRFIRKNNRLGCEAENKEGKIEFTGKTHKFDFSRHIIPPAQSLFSLASHALACAGALNLARAKAQAMAPRLQELLDARARAQSAKRALRACESVARKARRAGVGAPIPRADLAREWQFRKVNFFGIAHEFSRDFPGECEGLLRLF